MEDLLRTHKICHLCVGEEYLNQEIINKGKRYKCSFCKITGKTYSLQKLTDRIEKVFLAHYERTPSEPSSLQYSFMQDKESTNGWYREGQTTFDLLTNEFYINETAAGLISESLSSKFYDMDAASMGEETEFGEDVYYESKGISGERWAKDWSIFEETLKSEARFFSQNVNNILKSVFDGLDKFKTYRGRSVLTTIGPRHEIKSLFRARVFQSRSNLLEALCAPDQLLGSPPSRYAMSGRMNARGISVFYGATEEATAIAEVRPPVGSKVAVAKFDLIKQLQLLDLRELANVRELVSVFDPQYLEKMEKAIFLNKLGYLMTAPVMPDDELFDYLPTQAIAEYLASHQDVQYDGIVYPSVQVEGGNKINVVLFYKSAKIESIILPPKNEIIANDTEYTEEGAYTSYEVIEWTPNRTKKSDKGIDDEVAKDTRNPSLSIDTKSIHVHHIQSVAYTTESHHVDRKKMKKINFSQNKDFDF